jgi:hypothetical protein
MRSLLRPRLRLAASDMERRPRATGEVLWGLDLVALGGAVRRSGASVLRVSRRASVTGQAVRVVGLVAVAVGDRSPARD